MIKISVSKLKDELGKLNAYIEEYDLIELNLYNEVKNACSDWNDPRESSFEVAINKEKRESSIMLDSFKDVSDCLKYIISQYEIIGDRIAIKLESKASIIKAYGNIENRINSIISNINSVDMSFPYSELSSIRDMRNSFERVKSDLTESRDKVRDFYKRIERIEENVAARTRALKELVVDDFEFELDY